MSSTSSDLVKSTSKIKKGPGKIVHKISSALSPKMTKFKLQKSNKNFMKRTVRQTGKNNMSHDPEGGANVSVCRSMGREVDPGPVLFFPGD